ncbi:MAG: IS1595 family transposase [Bifidobacterium mongoliense]|nr:IS1595 family transposase [Bifidobacterium mongoliense]
MAHDTVAHPYDARPVAGWHYPGRVADFRAWFSTDEACRAYLDWLRWPDGFVCPHCEARSASIGGSGVYRCRGCRRRVSVTAGTIFDKTRVPLTTWFEAIWLFTSSKAGVSAATLHRVLPISSYQTVWTMLGKLRAVLSQTDLEPLTGRVEVDETFIGGVTPGKAGRGAAGMGLGAGAVEFTENGGGRARMAIIADASAASLRGFITANIAPGSTIVSDAWKGYPPAMDGYDHEPLNVAASGGPAHESLPAIHRIFSLVKRLLEGTYQGGGSREHLQEYLDEYVFRFNRRHTRNRGLVFMRLLQRAVASGPVTYRALVRISRPKAIHPTGVQAETRRRPGTLDVEPIDPPWQRARPR